KLIVTKWCLNEYLSDFLPQTLAFQIFYFLGTIAFVNGQITMKSKFLSIKTRSHQRQQYRAGSNHWHNLYASAMRFHHDVGSRVSHRRTAGLGHESQVFAFQYISKYLPIIHFVPSVLAIIVDDKLALRNT